MTGNKIMLLDDMIKELGEDYVKSILSSFMCPLNADVEYFLKTKAIEFSKQGHSKTYLVFTSYKDKIELIGYFTLAPKHLKLSPKALSKSLKKKIIKFATHDNDLKEYILPAILIGQLGKNYNNGLNKQITGDELLALACEKVQYIQHLLGGKVVYLECEDKPKLIEFYERNMFISFSKRSLEKDEVDKLDGKYLVQMIRYLKTKKEDGATY